MKNNKEIIKEFKPYTHIDTMTIYSTDERIGTQGIKSTGTKINKTTGEVKYGYKLNPNYYNNTELYIIEFEKLKSSFFNLLSENDFNSYGITRVDIATDTLSDNLTYDELHHFNRYLITAVCIANNINNRYESTDFLTFDKKTLRIKNTTLELEYYNKLLQAPAQNINSRLELRFINLNNYSIDQIKSIVKDRAIEKYKKSLLYLEDVRKELNKSIIKKYKENKCSKPSEIIKNYADYIFTRRQLLLLMQELENIPLSTADNKVKYLLRYYKNTFHFITDKDMTSYVNKIIKSYNEFFKCQKGVIFDAF